MADQTLATTPDILRRLLKAKGALHFGPDDSVDYTGVHEPEMRAQADAAFAHLVDTLISELPTHPSKCFVLKQIQATLQSLTLSDTEDRERAVIHCESVMDILGIERSDGVLNRWLYGLVLGSILSTRRP